MDDLISRQATIRFIRDKVNLSLFMKRSVDKADKACMELCEMLDRELPSAEVKPVKRGKWIVEHGVLYGHGKDVHYGDLWHCSECGRREIDVEGWDYCPTCGAKMEGVKE